MASKKPSEVSVERLLEWVGRARRDSVEGRGRKFYDQCRVTYTSDGRSRVFSLGDPICVYGGDEFWVAQLVEMFEVGDSDSPEDAELRETIKAERKRSPLHHKMRCTLRWFYTADDIALDSLRHNPVPNPPLEDELYFSDHIETAGVNAIEVVEGRAFLFSTEAEADAFVKRPGKEDYWPRIDLVRVVRCFVDTASGFSAQPIRELERGELRYLLANPTTEKMFEASRGRSLRRGAVIKGFGKKRPRKVEPQAPVKVAKIAKASSSVAQQISEPESSPPVEARKSNGGKSGVDLKESMATKQQHVQAQYERPSGSVLGKRLAVENLHAKLPSKPAPKTVAKGASDSLPSKAQILQRAQAPPTAIPMKTTAKALAKPAAPVPVAPLTTKPIRLPTDTTAKPSQAGPEMAATFVLAKPPTNLPAKPRAIIQKKPAAKSLVMPPAHAPAKPSAKPLTSASAKSRSAVLKAPSPKVPTTPPTSSLAKPLTTPLKKVPTESPATRLEKPLVKLPPAPLSILPVPSLAKLPKLPLTKQASPILPQTSLPMKFAVGASPKPPATAPKRLLPKTTAKLPTKLAAKASISVALAKQRYETDKRPRSRPSTSAVDKVKPLGLLESTSALQQKKKRSTPEMGTSSTPESNFSEASAAVAAAAKSPGSSAVITERSQSMRKNKSQPFAIGGENGDTKTPATGAGFDSSVTKVAETFLKMDVDCRGALLSNAEWLYDRVVTLARESGDKDPSPEQILAINKRVSKDLEERLCGMGSKRRD